MKKPKISTGPWKANGKGVIYRWGNGPETEDYRPCIAKVSIWKDAKSEGAANAKAIVTAVNETYHKGIDPEGVPELVDESNKALEKLHEFYYDHFVEKGYGHDAAEDRAQISTESLYQALKKAGVNINKKAE